MARSRRFDAPGAWHHVMHRGARREPIFRRDEHCLIFLASLQETVEHHGLEVHGFSLMPNHYHLLVRTPLGNLSRCMRHLNATFTQRVNKLRGRDGPVFRGRFRSQLVEDERYLDDLFAYVHLAPFEAGLATRLDDPCWTSLRAYLGKEQSPSWVRTDFFLDRLGGAAGIEDLLRAHRKHRLAWPDAMDRETGWIAAPEGAQRPRAAKKARVPRAAPVAAPTIAKVLKDVAAVAGCTVAEVKAPAMGPGANPARRLAVWALSRAKAYSHREIAAALGISEGQVAKVLWRFRQGTPPEPLPAWMDAVRARQMERARS